MLSVLLPAAALLSLERIFYVWVSNDPDRFSARFAGSRHAPTDVLRWWFYGFKALQLGVFAGWLAAVAGADFWRPSPDRVALGLGLVVLGLGQLLNLLVFTRLGRVGVFYGRHFGHDVVWCRRFPFSVLRHPQYVGAVLSIWGLFLAMRYPHPDWLLIPWLESIYYFCATFLEHEPAGDADESEAIAKLR